MPLCDKCSALTPETLCNVSIQRLDPSESQAELFYRHLDSVAALDESAKKCSLCKLILCSLEIGAGGNLADLGRQQNLDWARPDMALHVRAGDVYGFDSSQPLNIAMADFDLGGRVHGLLNVYATNGILLRPAFANIPLPSFSRFDQ
jgi:hypothetical protein